MNADINLINKKLDYLITFMEDANLTKDEYLKLKELKQSISKGTARKLPSIDEV